MQHMVAHMRTRGSCGFRTLQLGNGGTSKSPKLIPVFKGDMFFLAHRPSVGSSYPCCFIFCTGQKILMEQQESMSEEDKERMSKRKKKGEKEKGKEKGGKIKGISDKEKEIVKIYPSLKDLSLSSSASSDSELSKDDEADLEEEAARYERERYDPDWSYRTKPMKRGASANKRTKPKVPTAPPYNPDYTGKKESARAVRPGTSFCPEVWKEIGLTFPVFRLPNSMALDWTQSPWRTSPPGSPLPSHILRNGGKCWPGGGQWSSWVVSSASDHCVD